MPAQSTVSEQACQISACCRSSGRAAGYQDRRGVRFSLSELCDLCRPTADEDI